MIIIVISLIISNRSQVPLVRVLFVQIEFWNLWIRGLHIASVSFSFLFNQENLKTLTLKNYHKSWPWMISCFLGFKKTSRRFLEFSCQPPKTHWHKLELFHSAVFIENLAIRMNDFVFKLCFVSFHHDRVQYPFYFSKIKSKSAQTVTHSRPRLAALLWYACALCILLICMCTLYTYITVYMYW